MDKDAEIEAMGAVAKALEPLDEQVRQRVIGWAASRFGLSVLLSSRSSNESNQRSITSEGPRGDFETFAELFEAAGPKTDKDKALIAAYWAQICQGQPTFPAQALNDNLKDLGHGLSNVTAALEGLKEEKPALVLQLKKGGTSKQARKTYKLTGEGAKRVRQMINKEEEE